MKSAADTFPFRIEIRQARLRALLERRKLPLVLITNLTNVFYLTGFRGTAGVAAFGPSEGILWVDPRYTQQAREQSQGVEVTEVKGNVLKALRRWLGKKKIQQVGYEEAHLTCAQFRQLQQEAPRTAHFVAVGEMVEKLRTVKDPEEIECIRQAGRLTAAVFEEVLPLVRPGISEFDLATEIEYRMRRKGAEQAAFETIVASGPRGALPHARPTCKLLEKNELVVFDLGAILGAYAADMTRTVYLGRPTLRVRRLYRTVQDAQQRAIAAIRPGTPAEGVDGAARRVLEQRGLGKYFMHSTGHGVGLEIHERPRLAKGVKTRLEAGCVVTAEPGVYLNGFGGIRIEDTVLVRPEDPEVLTPASKDHWSIT